MGLVINYLCIYSTVYYYSWWSDKWIFFSIFSGPSGSNNTGRYRSLPTSLAVVQGGWVQRWRGIQPEVSLTGRDISPPPFLLFAVRLTQVPSNYFSLHYLFSSVYLSLSQHRKLDRKEHETDIEIQPSVHIHQIAFTFFTQQLQCRQCHSYLVQSIPFEQDHWWQVQIYTVHPITAEWPRGVSILTRYNNEKHRQCWICHVTFSIQR